MAEFEEPTGNPIDLRRDNIIDAEAQVDASLYKLAAVFGAVAFPPGMPDYQKIAVLDAAERERKTAGNFTIDNRMDGDEERAHQDRENGNDNMSLLANIVQQEKLEAAHEREWMATSHTYAGQKLDAAQWKQMINWFADDENVEQWEDAMMAETGQSREEVRQTGGKMKRFYDLMQKDAKGTLTGDEQREFDRLNRDKDVQLGVQVQQEIQGLQQSQSAEFSSRNETALDSDNAAKAAISFASTLADDQASLPRVANAASLTPVYREAATGEPKAPPQPSVTPSLSPSQTVQVSPDNMFG